MAKYKVSYKMLKEQTGVVAEISKQLMTIADELDGVANQLQAETATETVARVLMDAAATMNGYTDGLNNMGKTMQQIIDKYTKTENNNSKRVDSAKAHNRDFYKNAVSVPSASVGVSSGGGGVSAVASASGSGASAAAVVNVNVAGSTAGGGTTSGASMGGSSIPTAASAAPGASTASFVSGTSRTVSAAAGSNTAAVAGVAAAGAAAAGAAVAAGVASKKKKAKAQAEAAGGHSQAAQDLEKAERQLEEAIARAKAPS